MSQYNNSQVNKADYGQDMPGIIITSTITGIVFTALAVWQIFRISTTTPHPGLITALIFVALALTLFAFSAAGIWSSRYGKIKLRDKVFSRLIIKGSEHTLDVGCGKGLLLMEAAKRAPNGKATGADLWEKTLEYSYTARMAMDNARIEGVEDRVEIVTADVQAMPFGNNSFDIVMTSLMMHHVDDINKALNEMIRVTKPGGIIVIADVNSKRFLPILKSLGMLNVEAHFATRLFFVPAYVVSAVKP